jgi:hypothetical protein
LVSGGDDVELCPAKFTIGVPNASGCRIERTCPVSKRGSSFGTIGYSMGMKPKSLAALHLQIEEIARRLEVGKVAHRDRHRGYDRLADEDRAHRNSDGTRLFGLSEREQTHHAEQRNKTLLSHRPLPLQ